MPRRRRRAPRKKLLSVARGILSRLARPRARFDRPLARHARRPRFVLAAVLALAALVAMNLIVRSLGGDVHALSLGRVGDRAQALALLAVHGIGCPGAPHDPQAAVREAALQHGVPPRLALAVARTESSFVHTRISSTGAMGLMQLMPDTARELGVRDPFDVRDNAQGGVRYLAQLLSLYRGDARKAVAAYNAGMGRVPVRGVSGSLPAETRVYVGRVFSAL